MVNLPTRILKQDIMNSLNCVAYKTMDKSHKINCLESSEIDEYSYLISYKRSLININIQFLLFLVKIRCFNFHSNI